MACVLSFICESSKSGWTAKCCNKDDVDEISADDRWSLEKLLKEESIRHSSGGGVSSSFSWITPKTAIYQFIIGGAVMAVAAGGGGGGAAAGGGGEAKAEETKEPEKEESDESGSEAMFGLFD